MAEISGDPIMKRSFENGDDIHQMMAAEIFDQAKDTVTSEQRNLAKTINYGILYGMGSQKLAKSLGIAVKEAKGLIENYFQK